MNNRQRLALKIMEWSKGGNPSYALASNWFVNLDVPTKTVYDTILEFERIINKQVPFPEAVTDKDVRELKRLIDKIIKAAGCVLVVSSGNSLLGVFKTNEQIDLALTEYKKSRPYWKVTYWKSLFKIGEDWFTEHEFNWAFI